MSGESAGIVEVCSVAAASALVAARAVAGVTGTALSAPGAGLTTVAERMDQGYARHQERHAALAEWEAAAREVVDRNARLSVLAARPGGTPGLPAPLILQGQPLEELTQWCAATDQALAAVERTLLAEAASAVSVVLESITRGGTAAEPVAADEVLAQHQQRHSTDIAPPAELIEACNRILDRLVVDVPAAGRAEVLAAVERVHECRTPAERQGWLAELRVRVGEANDAAVRQREQARTAATMVQALSESTEHRAARLRAELAEVVAGRRALDPELRQKAMTACDQVRIEQESNYVREALARGLTELGYQVDQRFDTFTGGGARLRLVRDQWPEHAVSMVVDGDELRTMVVRTEGAEGDDAARLDVEREQQWCADFEELRDRLADDGLRVELHRLTPPGQRRMPLATRRRRPTADRGQDRHRAQDSTPERDR